MLVTTDWRIMVALIPPVSPCFTHQNSDYLESTRKNDLESICGVLQLAAAESICCTFIGRCACPPTSKHGSDSERRFPRCHAIHVPSIVGSTGDFVCDRWSPSHTAPSGRSGQDPSRPMPQTLETQGVRRRGMTSTHLPGGGYIWC